ncbi:hypothetical protein LO80_03420 [Candidatus Francisella endociliophora]|uniref:Putative exodeoxyribonuclease 8 PDDEXK-like domain-containing protein n=1 Tax=Candidatus Francisella endociliophora TaxID=653937 RepID=A0A097ENH1_9GAMM|nr:PD-(D/E)XK nuclease-like domain-containing protein [Francisella sp. FSC1006]AIT09109.1 hypothetical protein LO80_03420 [Francisella sp. FSC1006]
MDYYDHEAMSRSKLVDLDKLTPYEWYLKYLANALESKSTKALYFGSAFHCAILEPHLYNDLYCYNPYDMRTKQGKEFAEKNINKTILSKADNDLLNNMLFSLSNHPAHKIIKSCDLKEKEFYFDLEGVEFKAKLDAINTSKKIIFDVKTCREAFISPKQFASEMINYHNAEQVFIYSEAYRQKYGTNPKFYFICIEKKEPYQVQIWDASCLYEYGYKKTLELINKYKQLKEKYGDDAWIDNEILVAELPYYAEKYLMEGESHE